MDHSVLASEMFGPLRVEYHYFPYLRMGHYSYWLYDEHNTHMYVSEQYPTLIDAQRAAREQMIWIGVIDERD